MWFNLNGNYFKMLNATTKQAKRFIEEYQESTNTTLYGWYTTFSAKKQKAFEKCKTVARECNGYGLKIISANTSFFTFAFMCDDVNITTGEIENMLCIITKANNYAIKL